MDRLSGGPHCGTSTGVGAGDQLCTPVVPGKANFINAPPRQNAPRAKNLAELSSLSSAVLMLSIWTVSSTALQAGPARLAARTPARAAVSAQIQFGPPPEGFEVRRRDVKLARPKS